MTLLAPLSAGDPPDARFCLNDDCRETLDAGDAVCPWCHKPQDLLAMVEVAADLAAIGNPTAVHIDARGRRR